MNFAWWVGDVNERACAEHSRKKAPTDKPVRITIIRYEQKSTMALGMLAPVPQTVFDVRKFLRQPNDVRHPFRKHAILFRIWVQPMKVGVDPPIMVLQTAELVSGEPNRIWVIPVD